MVRLSRVSKRYGDVDAVCGIDLEVRQGEFLTLLGPSGCGKTTTLRLIAGFEQPSEGSIELGGEDVTSKPPYLRDVNTVFQSYALFPHMNVFDNVGFGLRMKKVPKNEIRTRVMEALRLIQLEHLAERKPDQLSGGQKQRVAIARAIVNNPKVLLLDEPLGALDLKLRKKMQLELKHLQQRLGITFVYVTHDQEEALAMSDRIAVMQEGKIEQIGTPSEIYEFPRSKFVADFIGETNLIEGVVTAAEENRCWIEADGLTVPVPNGTLAVGERVQLALRPERIHILYEPSDQAYVQGRVVERIYTGSMMKTIVALGSSLTLTALESLDHARHDGSLGRSVWLTWPPDSVVVIRE